MMATTQRHLRFTTNHGIARMAAAITVHTMVWTSLIAIRMFVGDMFSTLICRQPWVCDRRT